MLVIPGVTARFWTDRLAPTLLIAGALGAGAGVLGTALSAVLRPPGSGLSRGWPTGPLIVLVAIAGFAISAVAAPGRGWAAEWFRRRAQRRRIGRHHLLRAAFEFTEARAAPDAPWTAGDLLAHRRWTRERLDRLIRRAWRDGLVVSRPDGHRLTAAGRAEALQVVRAHRLWELYLIEQASIAPDHVDRDADEIEHILPPEVIERFEERLRESGRWPAPLSPHGLPGVGAAP
jgi:manganese/zinc/iron transport system permease protein